MSVPLDAGSDLVYVATALQSADVARESLVAISRTAQHILSHSIPAGQLRALLAGLHLDLQQQAHLWVARAAEVRIPTP
jgi:hypothetical protein